MGIRRYDRFRVRIGPGRLTLMRDHHEERVCFCSGCRRNYRGYTGRASRKYVKVWNMYSILVEAKCVSFLQGVQSDKRHTTTLCTACGHVCWRIQICRSEIYIHQNHACHAVTVVDAKRK